MPMHAEPDTAVAARDLERGLASTGWRRGELRDSETESPGSLLFLLLGKRELGWFRRTEDGEFFFVRAADGSVLRVRSKRRSLFFHYCLGLVQGAIIRIWTPARLARLSSNFS